MNTVDSGQLHDGVSARDVVSGEPARTYKVRFGRTTGLGAARADSFSFMGRGAIEIDGRWVRIYGRRHRSFRLGEKDQHAFASANVVNVCRSGRVICFGVRLPGEPNKFVWFRAGTADQARQIQADLPQEQTPEFTGSQTELMEFHQRLDRLSPVAPVTPLLVAANVLVFVAMCISGVGFFKPEGAAVLGWGSNFGPLTMGGEWWRLFTAMFVHFGVIHIAFNMWALLQIGRIAERLFGSMRFLLLYVLAGLIASMTSLLWNPEVNSAGASGAIFGILGGLLAFVLNPRNDVPRAVMVEHRNSTLVFAAYSLFYGFAHTGIDNAAHLGGLLSGICMGALLARPLTDEARSSDGSVRLLASISAAIIVMGLLAWPLIHPSPSVAAEQQFQLVLTDFGAKESQAVDASNQLSAKVRQGMSTLDYLRTMDERVLPKWDALFREVNAPDLPEDSRAYPLQQALLRYLGSRCKQFRLLARAARYDNKNLADAARAEQQNGDAAAEEIKKLGDSR
ncbi:MAG TPA: rhomboid family intramembrane serine protease [Rhodanobacteraceae bacterium]|nr:rhomboid family intramembrane serine protease [Rhodanobacteraceae bacterium]